MENYRKGTRHLQNMMHLETKAPFRLTEHPIKKHRRPPQLKQGIADINRRTNLVPDIFC
ncbi:MAG: hypothetical protein LBT00_09030 [Spirochaetaceae bacterium]|nr:hypothetical protein [Spirochaetaceae bacterium]